MIHRRDEEIEDLERKLHTVPEIDLYWTLIKEAGLENAELCDMVHEEMKKKGVK